MTLFARTIQVIVILLPVVVRARFVQIRSRFVAKRPDSDRELARALRRVLVRLGGAFVKFGQLLAMRPDLLSQDYIDELSELLDRVPPFSNTMVPDIIRASLGSDPGELFASFSDEPVAAASFAQVYKAVTKDNFTVAVKIQRPGVAELALLDLRIATTLAAFVDFLGIFNRVRISPIVNEFSVFTREELDYTLEGAHFDLMSSWSTSEGALTVPRVYWDLTTDKILTTDFLTGEWISDLIRAIDIDIGSADAKLAELDTDRNQVAARVFDNALIQAFRFGYFHADPHAGNLVVLQGGTIAYVDFGIVGYLDSEFRTRQLLILEALRNGDLDAYANAVLTLLTPPPENVDLAAFVILVKQNARTWLTAAFNPHAMLHDRSIASLFTRNLLAARKMGLSFQTAAIRYYRAISVSELIVLKLNPDFDIRSALTEFTRRELANEFVEHSSPASMYHLLGTVRQLAITAPSQILKALTLANATPRIARRTVSGVATATYWIFYVLSILLFVAAILSLTTSISAAFVLITGPNAPFVSALFLASGSLLSFVASRFARLAIVSNRIVER